MGILNTAANCPTYNCQLFTIFGGRGLGLVLAVNWCRGWVAGGWLAACDGVFLGVGSEEDTKPSLQWTVETGISSKRLCYPLNWRGFHQVVMARLRSHLYTRHSKPEFPRRDYSTRSIGAGPVTFVATKVTKNAVSANGFFALAGRTGGARSHRTNQSSPRARDIFAGLSWLFINRHAKISNASCPPARPAVMPDFFRSPER